MSRRGNRFEVEGNLQRALQKFLDKEGLLHILLQVVEDSFFQDMHLPQEVDMSLHIHLVSPSSSTNITEVF
jgi:hypothetical protein